jgi:hypothetical protein
MRVSYAPKKRGNNFIGILFIFLIVGAALYFGAGSSSHTFFNSTVQANGRATSISNVQFLSNYKNIDGPAYLVNFVVDGSGQSLNGTQSYIAKGINSSYSTSSNKQVSINFALTKESLMIPYPYMGAKLYQWGYSQVQVTYTPPGCPFGEQCQVGFTSDGSFNAAETRYIGGTDNDYLYRVVNGFSQACKATANGGSVVNPVAVAVQAQIAGIVGYNLRCIAPTQTQIATIYNSGDAHVAYNLSVMFSNGTVSQTMRLSDLKTSDSYSNILYAAVYGQLPSGKSILTSYPSIATARTGSTFTNGQSTMLVNPLSTSAVLSGSASTYTGAFPTQWLVKNVNIGSTVVSDLYDLGTLQSSITEQNQNLNRYLYAPQNSSIATTKGTILFSQGSPYLSIDMTSQPAYYPEVQLIAKVSTLAVYVPVSVPQILSVNPNPVTFQSGSQVTETFMVKSNVTGSAYISGACGSVTFSSSNFNLPAGQTVPVQVVIQSPVNSNLANTQVTCQATAYSSQFSIYSSTVSFSGTVKPNCPDGYIYQDGLTCKPIGGSLNNTNQTNVCAAGYKYENSVCVPTNFCPTGYILNTSVTPNKCDPSGGSTGQGIGIGWYIVGGVAVIVVIVLLSNRGNSGRRASGSRRVPSRPSGGIK